MTSDQYPEQRFRHSQKDRLWADKLLNGSQETMAKSGCLVTCVAYLISRFHGSDFTPGAWCDWLNKNYGFTLDGLMYWSKVSEYTNGKLAYTTNPLNRTYTMRNVWVMGANRKIYSHWVVELRGGLIFDPLDGTIKADTAYKPITNRWGIINRRYLKAYVKPKT